MGFTFRFYPQTKSNLICFNSAMRETKEAMDNVSVGLEVLQEGTGKLNFNLSLVRNNINRTLNDPGCHDEESDATTAQLCRNIRQSLSQLQIGANFTRVQKLNTTATQVLLQSNLIYNMPAELVPLRGRCSRPFI